MKFIFCLLVSLATLSTVNYLLAETPVQITKTSYAVIFKNGHGIIYSTIEEAEENLEGAVAFEAISYTIQE